MIKITIEIDMISISTKFELQTNGFNNTNNKFQSGTSYIIYLSICQSKKYDTSNQFIVFY